MGASNQEQQGSGEDLTNARGRWKVDGEKLTIDFIGPRQPAAGRTDAP